MRELVSTAKNYGLWLEAIDVPQSIVDEMPIWLHKQANTQAQQLAMSKEVQCLRTSHEITTVGEMHCFTAQFQLPDHKKQKNCMCDACKHTRIACKCKAPSVCLERANKLMSTLPGK
jgi:hypothetical protein